MYMADRASQEIIISSPSTRVLEVLLELDDYPSWIDDLKTVEIFERDSRGRAIRAQLHSNALGQDIVHTYKYDYTNYPSEIAWELESGNMVSSLWGRYVIVPVTRTETRVRYELELEMTAPLPGFIKKKANEKIVSSALDSLKRECERN